MKRNSLFFLLLSLFFLPCIKISAQISHGGSPVFLSPNLPPTPLKGESEPANFSPFRGPGSTNGNGVFEMPAFNLDSIKQEDQLNEKNMLRSYPFAHKFFTNIEKKRDAVLTVLPDGTKVWLINIRSQGAYSINVLLTDFELPPGGKLFVYNSDHSHVIGSFDYRNNSPEKILPIQPVAGESITIEYSEPADVPFEGNFTVSEVNHDYRDILKREPGNDSGNSFLCMPDALCSKADENTVRSTVLLMINGSSACTGVLVNNTENDGTPYLLTAVHCLNDSLEYGINKGSEYYVTQSGTVIAFFNYNRPVCGSRLKGTEEMSMAQTFPRVVIEKKDVALLELREKPPVYYNVYYAGWNMDLSGGTGTHVNLHHPKGDMKRYGSVETNLSVVSYPSTIFDVESHWKVPGWTVGSTAAGSSGSPLFDQNGLVIGTLSGGSSLCVSSSPNGKSDYFTALYKSWETTEVNNQLKTYLDPNSKGTKQQPGMDPNQDNPLVRLSNINFSAGDSLTVSSLNPPNSGYLFGSNNLNAIEFAEEFTINEAVEVFGAYLLVPPLTANGVSGVEVSIYTGTDSPETLIQKQNFSPRYLNYSSGFILMNKNMTNSGTETFVLFNDPVKIAKGKFFISYKINNNSIPFCVYNAKFAGSENRNTAWVKDPSQGWIPAVAYAPAQGMKTSLAIQPLVRSTIIDNLPEIPIKKEDILFFDSKNHLLSLREPAGEPIPVNIYSLTGVLMEKVQINPGEKTVFLTGKTKGTIGIVQLTISNKIYTKKIIY